MLWHCYLQHVPGWVAHIAVHLAQVEQLMRSSSSVYLHLVTHAAQQQVSAYVDDGLCTSAAKLRSGQSESQMTSSQMR